MNKFLLSLFVIAFACNDSGNLKVIADLPLRLEEASGIETVANSKFIWMLNDSGNAPKLFGLTSTGKIKKELTINAKNNDWEDLTSDPEGNIYIGDFGNNLNKRDNLAILKVNHADLTTDKIIDIDRISFRYPDQKKFPPKKKHMSFDTEAFFFLNDSLYIFTKNRVKGDYGKTKLYKVPATQGHHIATYMTSFTTCPELHCWITSADISKDGKKVVLLAQNAAWVFKDFKDDNFFGGTATQIPFTFESQKESVCFKNEKTLYITDERAHGDGGNLYKLKLN